MINIIIQGGFGNQLFQYAMGYSLAKRIGSELCLDVSFYDYVKTSKAKGAVRENNLNKLCLSNAKYISEPEGFGRIILGSHLHRTWLSWVLGFRYPVIWEDVANCRIYQPWLLKRAASKKNVILYGFWQNTKYFDDCLADLKRQFIPNYELDLSVKAIKDRIENARSSVGIHVRRGDFVALGWAEGPDYYLRAIEEMKQQIGDCQFFIISDDKEWAKEHFEEVENTEIINIKTPTCDVDEFFLLSLCHNQIISESTFGWWAAYLNLNPDRKIIIPSTAKGEMFPESWIRI